MDLGAFSISLAVKDIAASRQFYETLGFRVFGGDQAQNWLIMKSGTTLVGLFQGMFEKNLLTFNPGWDSDAKTLPMYTPTFAESRSICRHRESPWSNPWTNPPPVPGTSSSMIRTATGF